MSQERFPTFCANTFDGWSYLCVKLFDGQEAEIFFTPWPKDAPLHLQYDKLEMMAAALLLALSACVCPWDKVELLKEVAFGGGR